MPARDFTLRTTTAALRAAVARAARMATAKGTVPILGHLLLRAQADGLVIVGTDMFREATARAEAEVERPGRITAPAETLDKITDKLPKDAEVILQADAAELTLKIRCGRSRFTLASLDPDEFPEFDALAVAAGFPFAIEMAGKTLADLLDRVGFAMSKEETRHYLCGAYLEVPAVADDADLTLRLVGTDGKRLARIDTPHAKGLDPSMPAIIIPREFVPDLAKVAKEAGDAPVTLEVSPSLVRLTAGTTAITSRLVDGKFPDYARVIPTTFLREIRAPTMELVGCLARVRTLASDKVKGVRLTFKDELLAVSLDRPNDLFAGYDEVDIELTGPAGAADFDGAYLAEILEHSGSDVVRLKLGDTAAPAVIGNPDGTSLYVLMPLRWGSAGDPTEA